jgi:uncharacterized membrane protein
MNGSIGLLFHFIGFGIIFTALLGGWTLERKLRLEKEWNQKLFLGKINRRFYVLFSIAAVIMLVTGIMNIFNIYSGNVNLLYTEGWLIAKIILFAFFLINGTVLGPILVRRRTKLIQLISEKKAPEDAEAVIKIINKNVSTFYLVQFILLIIIIYLSIAGAEKHPGII